MSSTFSYPADESQPLATARAKLVRVRQLIAELRSEFLAYKENEPVSARFVATENGPQIDVSWKGLSLKVGVIIGDTIHNLRAALDLTASELARKFSGTDKNVYFPFSSSVLDFPAAIKSKNFDKCGEKAVAILCELQPYRGGASGLRSIHDLDIQDKHKALIPIHKTIDFEIDGIYDLENPSDSSPVSVKIPEISYLFPEGSVLGGSDVEQTLVGFANLLDGILDSFEPLLSD